MIGQKRQELNNLTFCDKFETTILDGQLCFSLDVANKVKKSTREGKTQGLLILVDPNPFRANTTKFKVYVHTLAQYTAYGAGAFAVSALKKMKGTDSFNEMPDNQKKCQVHNKERCEIKRFLDQVRKNCVCVPWVGLQSEKVGVYRV